MASRRELIQRHLGRARVQHTVQIKQEDFKLTEEGEQSWKNLFCKFVMPNHEWKNDVIGFQIAIVLVNNIIVFA